MCRDLCYAKRGNFRRPAVKKAHQRNFKFSRTVHFVPWMKAALIANFVRVLRVHCSGDFYNQKYIHKWQRIVRGAKSVQFFAYTRSWRSPLLLPALQALGAFPNFQLWWSTDKETGPAPQLPGIRTAYMAIDDQDAASAPPGCSLIFRDRPGTVMKKVAGVLVCPPENGVKTKTKITCSKCGKCWKPTVRDNF